MTEPTPTPPPDAPAAAPVAGRQGPAERIVAFSDLLLRRVSVAVWIWLAPVATLWPLLHRDEIAYLVDNDLGTEARARLARLALASVFTGLAAWVVYALVREPAARGRFDRAFARLNRTFAPLLAGPMGALLAVPGIEKQHPFWTWIAIASVTAGLGVVWGRLVRRVDDAALGRLARRTAPAAVAVALGSGVAYAWIIARTALAHHVHMRTQIYDLGIYDNILWNSTFGEFLRCSFIKGGHHTAAHFDPVLGLLVPFYRLAPKAETLLVAQAVWVATGVVPLLLAGLRVHRSAWAGGAMAVLYCLYPALHGANLFDFHSVTLAIPTILWVVYLVDTKATWAYVPALVLLLATREDMTLLACFIGFYAIWARRRPWLGLATIGVSLCYLVVVKVFVMPDSALLMKATRTTYSYIYFYADMIPHSDEGALGLVMSFFTNPAFVLQHALSEAKVRYLLAILGPLCGLPLLARKRLPLLAYGALFILLSSRRHMYSIHFQYNAMVIPFVVLAWMDGVVRLGRRYGRFGARRVAVVLGGVTLVATLLAGAKFGMLVKNKSFRAGWEPLLHDVPQNVLDRYAWFYHTLRDLVPPDAPVSASSRLGPHMSNRENVYRFPVLRDAEFVMVFSKDMGKKEKAALKRMKRRGRYELVAKKFGIEFYRRRPGGKKAVAVKKPRPAAGAKPAAVSRPAAGAPGGAAGDGKTVDRPPPASKKTAAPPGAARAAPKGGGPAGR